MTDEMTAAEYRLMKKDKPRKYRNEPTKVDDIRFASKREADRYGELRLMARAGEIEFLDLQPRYPLVVNGDKITTYVADFRYLDTRDDCWVVEDTKGVKTPVYKIKRKLMKALYDIDIREV